MTFQCYSAFLTSTNEIELIANAAESIFESVKSRGNTSEAAQSRVQGNALTRAGLVLLCGFFEGFVRDLSQEYIDILNDGKVGLVRYPPHMFCAILKEFVDGMRPTEEDLPNKFNRYVDGIDYWKIDKRKFSKTGGNPSVDNIEVLFERLGMPIIIDELSVRDYGIDSTFVSESQVKVATRTSIINVMSMAGCGEEIIDEVFSSIERQWLPKMKRRKVGYVNEIEQLLKKRNRIAHGEGSEQITTQDLRNHLAAVAKLVQGMSEVTAAMLSTLLPEWETL